MLLHRRFAAVVALLSFAAHALGAQDHGSAALHELVGGLTVTPRVLLIGARPEDADAELISWLARGQYVETGYLSFTRGESSPNFAGTESAVSLGAIHTLEALAARRIDGGEQFFTSAYDFGAARNSQDAFQRWDHQRALGDLVTIIRSFRPHVIIAMHLNDSTASNGQRQAVAQLTREAFDAAPDSARFPVRKFGVPWTPQALYERAPGFDIVTSTFDPTIGKTFGEIGAESRSQLRSVGFGVQPWKHDGRVTLRIVASRTPAPTNDSSSLFKGIDTSFARLSVGLQRDVAQLVLLFIASADSARMALDPSRPVTATRHLANAADAISTLRGRVPGCSHPDANAQAPYAIGPRTLCTAQMLDADASVDLAFRRTTQALLIAAGVTVDAIADREFVAKGDTASVTVTIHNFGEAPIRDVSISGSLSERESTPIVVPPHGSVQLVRQLVDVASANPWWVGDKKDNMFTDVPSRIDGLDRVGIRALGMLVSGIAIPEEIRRLSDVTLSARIAGISVTTSIGPVIHPVADPIVGVQSRAVSGVPAVTLAFERSLEWVSAKTTIDRRLSLAMRSMSDKPRSFQPKSAQPDGIRVDSLPKSVTLEAGEQSELPVRARGKLDAGRYEFGVYGVIPAKPDTDRVQIGRVQKAKIDIYAEGFRTAQYSYLPPLHMYRQSALYLQAVDVVIPERLSVAYVRGVGDDGAAALKQVGIPCVAFDADQLLRLDLAGVSTVVIGPQAYERQRSLAGQNARLREFVRKGGTLVVMSNAIAATDPTVLPYAIIGGKPATMQVMSPDAPVSAINKQDRLLNWPNVIGDADWDGTATWQKWIGERALNVPTVVDPHWATVVQMQDPGQSPTRNAILVASVGKGKVIYTTLTLPQQLANGVSGGMRLFVNLLSAGFPETSKAVR